MPFNGPFELRHVPWVAGDLGTTLGTATGAALALQDEGSDRVCVCAFGDGTANRGDFHENVNLAACWKLPDRLRLPAQRLGDLRSRPTSTCRPRSWPARAGYGIPGVAVDGNDVEAVRAAVGEAIARARRGDGPTPDRGAHLAPARPLGRRRRRPTAHGAAADRRRDPLERPGRAAARARRGERRRRWRSHRDEAEAEVAEAVAPARRRCRRPAPPSLAWTRCSRERVAPRRRVQATRRLTQTEAIVEAIAQEMRRDRARLLSSARTSASSAARCKARRACSRSSGRAASARRRSRSRRWSARPSARRCSAGARSSRSASASSCPAAMNQLINQAPNLHYMTGGAAQRARRDPHPRRRRPVRRPSPGLLGLVRLRARPEGRHAGHAGRRARG